MRRLSKDCESDAILRDAILRDAVARFGDEGFFPAEDCAGLRERVELPEGRFAFGACDEELRTMTAYPSALSRAAACFAFSISLRPQRQ